MKKAVRTKRLGLRLTEEEYTTIVGKAEFLGVDITTYVVTAAVNKRVPGWKLEQQDEDDQIEGD